MHMVSGHTNLHRLGVLRRGHSLRRLIIIDLFLLPILLPGYIGGYLTVYNDVWCNYPSAQVHEVSKANAGAVLSFHSAGDVS